MSFTQVKCRKLGANCVLEIKQEKFHSLAEKAKYAKQALWKVRTPDTHHEINRPIFLAIQYDTNDSNFTLQLAITAYGLN